MIHIKIPVKALSINKAFQGRRFKTKECNQYCKDLCCYIPRNEKIEGFVVVKLDFYLKNWKMTDGDNLVKVLMDCIVQNGVIEDDRKIMRYIIEKHESSIDYIEVEIEKYC